MSTMRDNWKSELAVYLRDLSAVTADVFPPLPDEEPPLDAVATADLVLETERLVNVGTRIAEALEAIHHALAHIHNTIAER